MLLTARQILLIHFLMRLPDFVRPALECADRFVRRFQKAKLFSAFACQPLINRPTRSRLFDRRSRGRMIQRLPRSKTQEG